MMTPLRFRTKPTKESSIREGDLLAIFNTRGRFSWCAIQFDGADRPNLILASDIEVAQTQWHDAEKVLDF